MNWWKLLITLMLLAGVWCAVPAYGKPFDCSRKCGLPVEAPYPNIVVGTIDGVATEQQSKQIYTWARRHGYWKNLPASSDKFWSVVQLVSLSINGKRSITVLVSQSEERAAPLKEGDWARYAPHRTTRDKPAADDIEGLAYWASGGCILVMCRGEKSICDGHYIPGIYQSSDGTALKDDGKTVDHAARPIDPRSMLPR
ncbi:hypothetical protein [Uliginosibacterium gangwonense]|uniref:hypothetical protein n=1 Tax=Uliginosibacterium gangwonense TaxID=392736 RepID=UPI0003646B5C|nr:hypothetical protein [Uliginosibacterium gangwonense]